MSTAHTAGPSSESTTPASRSTFRWKPKRTSRTDSRRHSHRGAEPSFAAHVRRNRGRPAVGRFPGDTIRRRFHSTSARTDQSKEFLRYRSEVRQASAEAAEGEGKRTRRARPRTPDKSKRDIGPALITGFRRPLLSFVPAGLCPSPLSPPRLSSARSPCTFRAPSTWPLWARRKRSARPTSRRFG